MNAEGIIQQKKRNWMEVVAERSFEQNFEGGSVWDGKVCF